MAKKTLIVVVGPTAIGKTRLGIALAKHFSTEVVSADSRQFFKEMSIGTAVPSAEELEAVKHHFIQHISIEENYSVGDYEREALELLSSLFLKKDVVILVGGSGLYVDAVVKGLDNFPQVDPSIRKSLNDKFEAEGLLPLQKQLKDLDPEYYDEVDLQNHHRVIRALEICLGTNRPYSSFRKQEKEPRSFETITIGISAARETVYSRINQRVDIMMSEGLLKEVKDLQSKKELNALNTVGYKELFKHLSGEWTLEQATDEIKKNTRRFAKRQFTWFRKNDETNWFDYQTPPEDIIGFVEEKITPKEL
jgi:tRNA dimethylallyltransferase